MPTCIRVSVFRAHAESIYLELENEINLTKIRQDIEAFPGLSIIDDRKRNYFPMPLESTKKDEIFVGRLRKISGVNSSTRYSVFLKTCFLPTERLLAKRISLPIGKFRSSRYLEILPYSSS